MNKTRKVPGLRKLALYRKRQIILKHTRKTTIWQHCKKKQSRVMYDRVSLEQVVRKGCANRPDVCEEQNTIPLGARTLNKQGELAGLFAFLSMI